VVKKLAGIWEVVCVRGFGVRAHWKVQGGCHDQSCTTETTYKFLPGSCLLRLLFNRIA